ncbi:transcription elongation factor SPT4 [Thrips palmi]|uniref:Transcription elongation factor SPT4 n=1 Tax=Thrips palmi TaxID=161013 RepID=A0A6P8Z2U7_THRPL|nr:transcription elongation factor SPT4 [Thrips palmi]
MSLDTIPKDLRHLRACLSCSLIKNVEQFENDGCENCDEFLHMKSDREKVFVCTSNNFDGMISLMSPDDSWVAKWQRINRFNKGIYAISVSGKLPPVAIRDMKNRGISYKSRDNSTR